MNITIDVQKSLTMLQSRSECATPKVVGANIATRRRALAISQERLGAAIGRDRFFIGRMEKGQGIDFDLVPAIAKELQLKDPYVLLKPDAFL